jgi:DNA-binding MarR family transcriptional regulator
MSLTPERRQEVIAEVARLLPQRNGRLVRLLWRHARGRLPRGMTSVLTTLEDGPETISRLADKEGTAQPTLTRIIQRLEADQLVRRTASASDRRVVVVELTDLGVAEIAATRARYLGVLTERLSHMTDEQLERLLAASEVLDELLGALRDEPVRRTATSSPSTSDGPP